jgi:hypothetical protein
MASKVRFLDVVFASTLKDGLASFPPDEMKRLAELD